MKKYLKFWFVVLLFTFSADCFTEEISNFFTNSLWEGKITGAVREQRGKVIQWYPFEVFLQGFGIEGEAKISATYPTHFVYSTKIGILITQVDDFYLLTFLGDVGDPAFKPVLGYMGVFNGIGFKIKDFGLETLEVYFAGREKEDGMRASGKFWRVKQNKLDFKKEVKTNFPIKTDHKTQLKIHLPSKNILTVSPNSELIFKTDSLVEIMKGKMYSLIKKLKPGTKFEVKTPNSGTGVRGTEFVLNVEDDGSTKIIVLDGEVEFADKEYKKRVIVRNGQTSTITKLNGLPSEAVRIDLEKNFKWWEY